MALRDGGEGRGEAVRTDNRPMEREIAAAMVAPLRNGTGRRVDDERGEVGLGPHDRAGLHGSSQHGKGLQGVRVGPVVGENEGEEGGGPPALLGGDVGEALDRSLVVAQRRLGQNRARREAEPLAPDPHLAGRPPRFNAPHAIDRFGERFTAVCREQPLSKRESGGAERRAAPFGPDSGGTLEVTTGEDHVVVEDRRSSPRHDGRLLIRHGLDKPGRVRRPRGMGHETKQGDKAMDLGPTGRRADPVPRPGMGSGRQGFRPEQPASRRRPRHATLAVSTPHCGE